MTDIARAKSMDADEELALEREVRIAELLARRAEARLRQLEAERKRSELLKNKKVVPADM